MSALDGVPIGWKDLIDVAGARTTAGSNLFRDAQPRTVDAPIVANAAAAGMVCIGKLNLTEFAYSGLGLNPNFGTPVNPNDAKVNRAPGGSSSGCGVAVGAGILPLRDRHGYGRFGSHTCGIQRSCRVQDQPRSHRRNEASFPCRARLTRSVRWQGQSRIAFLPT